MRIQLIPKLVLFVSLCSVIFGDRVKVKQNSNGNIFGVGDVGHINYDDRSCHSIKSYTKWWNAITQIKPTDGECVRIWSRKGCRGDTWCVCEEITDLSDHKRNSGDNWNDDISSISGCGYRKPIVAIAQIYDDRDYGGKMRKITLQTGECHSLYGSDWWNDRLSSIKVTKGCIKFYSKSNCNGPNFETRSDKYKLGSDWNNEISSFEPC